MVRGGIRPEVGVRGVRGRGKIDRDRIAGKWSAGDRVCGKKFGYGEPSEPQQMPGSARTIVVANDFDSHVFSGRILKVVGEKRNHGCTQMNTDKELRSKGTIISMHLAVCFSCLLSV